MAMCNAVYFDVNLLLFLMLIFRCLFGYVVSDVFINDGVFHLLIIY